MPGCPDSFKNQRNIIHIAVALCVMLVTILAAAGCLSLSGNRIDGTVPTISYQNATLTAPVSNNLSGVNETNTLVQKTLFVESKIITQNVTQISPIVTSTITKKATFSWDVSGRSPESYPHFYIVGFNSTPVVIKHKQFYRIDVPMKAVNWKSSSVCSNYYCSDNLNTILIRLDIIGYSGKEIKFNSFGLGGEGSADFSVGYEIGKLPVGKYTLEFSTPDSVVKKDVEVI